MELHGWNDCKNIIPEIKRQPNNRIASDPIWLLLIDGTVLGHTVRCFLDSKTEISWGGIKKDRVSHWAYNIPPPLPEEFTPKKIKKSF